MVRARLDEQAGAGGNGHFAEDFVCCLSELYEKISSKDLNSWIFEVVTLLKVVRVHQ